MPTQTPTTPLPYVTKTRQDCAQLFILYTGMAGRLMIPPMDFIHQTRIVDRNLMMLRDLNQCCYQRGLSADISDIPRFLSWQQTMVQKFSHVREVFCIGSSGGAYAALLSGHFLKAVKVWAFAPPVPVQRSEQVPYLDEKFCDLSSVLERSNEVSEYEVFYNERQEWDRAAAQKLRDLPGVRLCPQAGEGHGVIAHMANNGMLANLLPDFVRA